jgi:hypothetical protein
MRPMLRRALRRPASLKISRHGWDLSPACNFWISGSPMLCQRKVTEGSSIRWRWPSPSSVLWSRGWACIMQETSIVVGTILSQGWISKQTQDPSRGSLIDVNESVRSWRRQAPLAWSITCPLNYVNFTLPRTRWLTCAAHCWVVSWALARDVQLGEEHTFTMDAQPWRREVSTPCWGWLALHYIQKLWFGQESMQWRCETFLLFGSLTHLIRAPIGSNRIGLIY